MQQKPALIIMLKNPVQGKVKTRLAADIGNEKALNVYLKLLQHTLDVTKNVHADKFIFYSDIVERSDMFDNILYKKYTQCSGDLGVRMDYAFSIPFKNEYKDVIMIGADCYELTQQHIEKAFEALAGNNDFVIGPANDGGYYLIGMKKWNRWVLENKNWSTSTLFTETKNDILGRNGKLFELETLSDIDTISDIQSHANLMNI
jgi:rSAM/selenodomain-associated transferase 1